MMGTQYTKKKCIYSIFPHYLMKETIFARKLLNKKSVWILSVVFSETLLILRRNDKDMIKTYIGLHTK